MFGWRGKIGYVCPCAYFMSGEYERLLPRGVQMFVETLNVGGLVPKEMERVFELYRPAAEYLAKYEVDFIFCGGTPILTYNGYEKCKEMASRIEETTGIPTKVQLTNQFDALNKLSANKKIVLATPYTEERTKERVKLLEELGFEVLSAKCTGKVSPMEIAKQSPDAAYRLAKEAFLEAPEADTIYISCPAWEVVANIGALERDTGRPVVAAAQADVWAALTTMGTKEPIEEYGRLLETL